MHSFASRFIFLAAAFSIAPILAHAQSDDPSAKPAPKWLVNCSNQLNQQALSCSMSQTIIEAETGRRIVTSTIFRNQQGNYFMRLLLPHGLDLANGVSMSIDGGNPSRHTINTADANGSYARIPLDDGLINALKAGNALELGIKNISGDNLILNVSLEGFTTNFTLLGS